MSNAEITPQTVHEILAKDFTDRYLERSGIGGLAYSVGYDPDNPLCNYEKTWWEAKPNRLSAPIGKLVLGKMHHMSRQEIDKLSVAPFVEKADDITQSLQEYPVMLVNGHNIDLQAALSLLSSSLGVARASTKGRRQRNLEDMIKVSHGVATRGLAPIIIGKPRLPMVSFMRLQQLVVNPHLSFPINQQMIESGISPEFRKTYNAKLRAESIAVAQGNTKHPLGYRTMWSLSPGGTPDIKGTEAHEGKLLTKKVEPATLRLIGDMGCGLLPVYTTFGRGKRPTVIALGDIIPPNEITPKTVPTIMADLAEFRRLHGESNVYYEEEIIGT